MSTENELKADRPDAVLGVGDRLRIQREARGITLDEVSQTLKISKRLLEQVEANAWSQLPGHTFARGVVRGYAKFVQLDAEPLMRELESAPLPKPPVLELPESTRAAIPVPGQTERRDRVAMAVGVLVVAAAVMAYFLVPEDLFSGTALVSGPQATVSQALPGATVESVAASGVPVSVSGVAPDPAVPVAVSTLAPDSAPAMASAIPAPAVSPPLVTEGQLLLIRFDETSWIEVRDRSGVLVLSENVAGGSVRSLSPATPISLALGNADGVRVSFRGQSIDLKPHTRQKVARLSLE